MSESPELSVELLAKPAPHAVRRIAVARLADVSANYERLWSGEDDEVHDLRVALRRLRSWLRAFRPELDDTLRRKTRRRLNELARITNAARDAEVALAWIETQSDLSSRDRAGARYLTERLTQELEASNAAMRETLEGGLPKVLGKLSGQLDKYWERHSLDESAPLHDMASVTRDVLRRHGDRLATAIGDIESPADDKAVHRARIAAKRLRYLLETLNGDSDAAALVARLVTLQDTLGVVHDSHRIADRVVRVVGERAAEDARRVALDAIGLKKGKGDDAERAPAFAKLKPGLLSLARRAHERERQAFSVFRRRWRRKQIESAVAEVAAVADGLG